MFTGIVEEVGKVRSIKRRKEFITMRIQAEKVLEDVQLGDSIATNGVCLTVTELGRDYFQVDLMPKTMENCSLGELEEGVEVNLERALQLSSRLGGHLVSGHVDGVGEIISRRMEGNAIVIKVQILNDLAKYIIYKGSITVDGLSLTVMNLTDNSFTISLIPHTRQVTTLGKKGVGEKVNLEVDLIVKYVERLLRFKSKEEEGNSKIDLELLRDNGFL